MSNFAAVLAKLTALAGGALAGALLARWFDELLVAQTTQRSDYDKVRYAQGLGPVERRPQAPRGIQAPIEEQ